MYPEKFDANWISISLRITINFNTIRFSYSGSNKRTYHAVSLTSTPQIGHPPSENLCYTALRKITTKFSAFSSNNGRHKKSFCKKGFCEIFCFLISRFLCSIIFRDNCAPRIRHCCEDKAVET